MKIERVLPKKEKQFKPVTIMLTFQTPDEIQAFWVAYNSLERNSENFKMLKYLNNLIQEIQEK